jgi:hypothetical protein
LIILGSSLEIYYYAQRFVNDGISVWLSILIGIALTLFLSVLMIKRDKPVTWFLIIPLAIYSIICTSAGQSFSLSVLENKNIQESIQDDNRGIQIDEYLRDIELLNKDLEQLSEQITVTTTWARNKYGDAVEAVQKRQDELRAEKKDLQNKISELRTRQTSTTEKKKQTTNIYQFYKNLFGFNASFLQFFLQTVLSFFIAAMAPFGIIVFTGSKKKDPEEKKPQKKQLIKKAAEPEITEDHIERWVRASWFNYRRNTKDANMIISKAVFMEYMISRHTHGKERILFTGEIYNKIFNIAVKKEIIDKKGIIKYLGKEDDIVKILKGGVNARTINRTVKSS